MLGSGLPPAAVSEPEPHTIRLELVASNASVQSRPPGGGLRITADRPSLHQVELRKNVK